DVPRYALNSNHYAVLIDRPATNFDGHPAAVLCYYINLEGRFTVFSQLCIESFTSKANVVCCHKFDKVMTDDFFASVSCQYFSGAVYTYVITFEIVNVNGIPRVLKQLPITLFALAQRYFNALAFGN